MPPYSKSESDESVFNMALAYLIRIDRLLNMAQDAALQMNMDSWLNNLRGIEREISVKTNEEEDKDLEKDFNEINKFMANPQNKISNKQTILMQLHRLDKKMRRLMQKKGMLLPSKENAMFAVLKR